MPRGSGGGGGSRGGGGRGGGGGGSWGGGHGGGGRPSGSWGGRPGGGGKVWSRPGPGYPHGGWPRPRAPWRSSGWWNLPYAPSDFWSYTLPAYPYLGYPNYYDQFNPLPTDLSYAGSCYMPNGACINNVTPLRCSANGGISDPLQPCSFTGRPAFGNIFPWRNW